MGRFAGFLRAHTLWVGFLVVVVPVAVFLGLQYDWLCRLEEASAIARQAARRNALDAVATEVEYFYRASAERLLNVPSSSFRDNDLSAIARQVKKKSLEGVRRLFLVDYTRVPTGNFYVFDPGKGEFQPSPASDESLAVVIACLPFQAWVQGARKHDSPGFQVNEQDPTHRIVLNPVTNEQSNIVGVVALILDETYFRETLLPATLEKLLPAFFPLETRENLLVTVRDQEQKPVLGGSKKEPPEPTISLRFPFVFTDWTLALSDLGANPGKWARGSFTFNMSLAILLALVILGAVLMALRAANRTMRLSQMKSDFVSNVSHELRTPLASIRVFAEFLRLGRAETSTKVEEYGELIEVESHRLSRLIENILDFSRIESDRKTYRFEPTGLTAIVESVMKSFQVRLNQAGFEVAVNLPEAPLPVVSADPDAISQALHNLMDNAMKYSRDAKHIEVDLGTEDGFQVIAVKDHGIGIAREEQGRIFERFHRVGTGLVHDVKGNGLGLSLVHHIVRAHGGDVTVESEPGKGSRFAIRLPVGKPVEG